MIGCRKCIHPTYSPLNTASHSCFWIITFSNIGSRYEGINLCNKSVKIWLNAECSKVELFFSSEYIMGAGKNSLVILSNNYLFCSIDCEIREIVTRIFKIFDGYFKNLTSSIKFTYIADQYCPCGFTCTYYTGLVLFNNFEIRT